MDFTKEELEVIKIDIKHILSCVDLSEKDESIRESIIDKIDNDSKYSYEISYYNKYDFCEISGWKKIDITRINPVKLTEYINKGLIRKIK